MYAPNAQFTDGGKVSQYLGQRKVGDLVEFSGPFGHIEYTKPGTFLVHKKPLPRKKHFGMIAGGTGITPMLQIITAVLENPRDTSTMSLIYANKTEVGWADGVRYIIALGIAFIATTSYLLALQTLFYYILIESKLKYA